MKEHPEMRKRTQMQPRTDITYEFPFLMISTNYKYSWRYYHADLVSQIWNISLYVCSCISPFPFPLQVVGYLLTTLLQGRHVTGKKSDIKYKIHSPRLLFLKVKPFMKNMLPCTETFKDKERHVGEQRVKQKILFHNNALKRGPKVSLEGCVMNLGRPDPGH